MITVIDERNRHLYHDALQNYFRLRHQVFVGRLSWALDAPDGEERDQFDTDAATYLLAQNATGEVIAGARMLRTDRPNLLADVFPFLCDGPAPRSPSIWEVTRLVVDHRKDRLVGCGNVTGSLLCGLLEFGLCVSASHLVSVSDTRIERILRMAAWTIRRLGEVHDIDGIPAVAELQALNSEVLNACRAKMRITGNVLSHPEPTRQAA
ncbi:MAG: GNAT family N-acetyltransferase [Alphaproteobacteria bacterium]|nr:GNAT family N-acetyltransferase [Alphaproteobacteria bacterium]